MNQLVNASPDGKTVVQNTLRELRDAGYAILVTVYDDRKLAGKRWDITDYPEHVGKSDDELDDFPTDSFPDHRDDFQPTMADFQPTDNQGNRRTENMIVGKPRRISTLESLSTLEKKSKKTPSLVLPPGETPHANFDDQNVIEEEELQEKKPRQVGTGKSRPSRRCPEDFSISEGMRRWAEEQCPGVSVDRETEKLRDYEFPKAHMDWIAVWRNWMRRAFDDLQRRPHPGYQRPANGYQAGGAAAPRQTNDPVADRWINRTDEPVRASHKVFARKPWEDERDKEALQAQAVEYSERYGLAPEDYTVYHADGLCDYEATLARREKMATAKRMAIDAAKQQAQDDAQGLPTPDEVKGHMAVLQGMIGKISKRMDMDATLTRENRPRRLGIVQDDPEVQED